MTQNKHLQSAPLDLAALLTETEDPDCGALVVFSGTVRNHFEGKAVARLEYSTHAALVDKMLGRLEQEVIERFGVRQCRIVHREGTLDVGDDSVFVVVRSAHRGDAFTAARYAIDELKQRAPVWKREHYADGSIEYQEGLPLHPGAAEDGAA